MWSFLWNDLLSDWIINSIFCVSNGKLVKSINYTENVDLSRLKNGVYLLRVSSERKVNTLRIIKNQ